ncbi:MAG: PLP-dependent transferase [Desulfuromonadaceae bacterium]|nr:PLP-dependent transferase [Desulfuromonadaceae bacterium]MDD5104521.1 PLP-dependent transferase [Desulfuromonadaceae bacterium]
MVQRNLLDNPAWRPEELGQSLPDSRHAVSVALPRWQDVVGYEEKSPEVINRLQCGYPRFVIHRSVQDLARQIAGDRPCLPFPSRHVARLCVAFMQRCGDAAAQIIERDGQFGVVTSVVGYDSLKAFWQHTGMIVSSRRADAACKGAGHLQQDDTAVRHSLRCQLAELYDCSPDDVFLQPSGMAATYAALRIVLERTPDTPTVQIGFPYVDTLKLQEKLGHGATLLHDLTRCPDDVEMLLQRGPLAGCFGEIPGNPLLGSADLRLVTPVLRRHGVPFIADDVVATPFNVNLTPHADMIATSLTKYLVGTGDAMGGALICNPRSPYHAELKTIAAAQHEELLWIEDAVILETQVKRFPERMRIHNRNGKIIAERLHAHPLIEQVWYPKWSFGEAYEAVRRPEGGWGSLITFLPKNAETASPRLYDNLHLCKGPSLGTSFTLACPFTLLAHYTELDWAEACGIPRNLIRLSIGLEDPEELWQRIEYAITA